jgi:hypothetical protein
MSATAFPSLLCTTSHPEADHLGWVAGQPFTAYGLPFGLRANDPVALDALCAAVPLGWQIAPASEVDVVYTLCVAPAHTPGSHQLLCDAMLIASDPDLALVLGAFTRHAELLTATLARDGLFVHAGVVGWQGQAILIPGRSFSGKTTLVKALVEAGATYYSDEFAILDQQGLVHPYALPLSLRDPSGHAAGKLAVASFGGQAGTAPLPVGLVILTQYQVGGEVAPAPAFGRAGAAGADG